MPVTVNRFEMDTITDFSVNSGDVIDLDALFFTASTFTGTAADAIAQGYIYFTQHGVIGMPGFGTIVNVDLNGGPHTAMDALLGDSFAVADLQGVARIQLNDTHFLV